MIFRRRFIDPHDQYRRWIDGRLSALRLADVTAYLRQHGWTEVPAERHGFRVFREPPGTDGGPYHQFIPESESDDDYTTRLFEFFTGLADFENRQVSAIIDDIVGIRDAASTNGATCERPTKLTGS